MKRGRELDVGRVRELSGGWALIQLEFRNWHDAEGEKWAGCNPALRCGEKRRSGRDAIPPSDGERRGSGRDAISPSDGGKETPAQRGAGRAFREV
jgi:hypothetical protein